MLRLWLSAVLVVLISSTFVPAQGQPATSSCMFAGQTMPCTVETDVSGQQTITLEPIKKSDWEFLERDMARDATALHAELLNNTTWNNAQRYALSQIYRQYRATQAMKLATFARFKIMEQIKAKYGDLGEEGLIEAVVIEAGLPVINVPSLIENISPGDLLELGGQSGSEVPGAK